uniref:Uncharacterized protein n=1 Tax=Oryza meridionalis TaxID=40149 RepID=A0A0E0E0A3_9ORYZ
MASLLTPSFANLKSPTTVRSDARLAGPLSLPAAMDGEEEHGGGGGDGVRRYERALALAAATALVGHLTCVPVWRRRADGAFCVCKPDQSPAKAIDYTCWRGADYTQIMLSGAYYQPSTIGGGGEILRRRSEQTAHDGAERTVRGGAEMLAAAARWSTRRTATEEAGPRANSVVVGPSSCKQRPRHRALATGPRHRALAAERRRCQCREEDKRRERLLEGGDDMWASLTF